MIFGFIGTISPSASSKRLSSAMIPTIAAKFNTYRFKDYKEKVIDLLARVARVSVETMDIVEAMKTAKRG